MDAQDDEEPPPTLADLYRARRLDMVRLAIFLVDDPHTAEDVVQDAFAAVCRRHGARLDDLQDAHAYLHTAVVNAARSVLRRRRTARAYTAPYQDPGAPVDEPLLLRPLRDAECMRYAQGGGLTDERRAFREKLRSEAAERPQQGDENADIAHNLRVSVRSVQCWRKAWPQGGSRP
ncbi:sigma factor [Streptomyces sp. NPDC059850]|uniref:sigma factor n=1 Tax=Streptomyces sp. NPDC059850 TaxID=3346970 RepID=UPI0036470A71